VISWRMRNATTWLTGAFRKPSVYRLKNRGTRSRTLFARAWVRAVLALGGGLEDWKRRGTCLRVGDLEWKNEGGSFRRSCRGYITLELSFLESDLADVDVERTSKLREMCS
jgi:hypothetical protein